MSLEMREALKERAYADCVTGYCPDVTELVPAPEIECNCGYAGRATVIISHLHEALCPECKTWIKYIEAEE